MSFKYINLENNVNLLYLFLLMESTHLFDKDIIEPNPDKAFNLKQTL
jgi:hypothetical protein